MTSFVRHFARLRARLDLERDRREKLLGKALRDPSRFLSESRWPALRALGARATDWGLLRTEDFLADVLGPRALVRGHRDPGEPLHEVVRGALTSVFGNRIRGFAETSSGPAALIASVDDEDVATFFAAQRGSADAPSRTAFDACIDLGESTSDHVILRVRCAVSGRDLSGSPARVRAPRYEGAVGRSVRGRIVGRVRDVATGAPVHLDVEVDGRTVAHTLVKAPSRFLPAPLDTWMTTFVASYVPRRDESAFEIRVRGSRRPLLGTPLPFASPFRPRADLVPPASAETRTVHVIVPVYAGLEVTLRCVESVLAAKNDVPLRLTLIFDAGPEPALLDALRARARGRFELLENPENLGFVRTCNRGMRLYPELDVVLLNSDTEVADGWLDRLARAGRGAEDIGTATPFSNAATICTYPMIGEEHAFPPDVSLRELDGRFAKLNAGQTLDLPTGHGFCIFLRRTMLDAVGLFDEEAFGRGYGEENDLCLRGRAAGFRSVLACDVFVKHVGSVSFGAERSERVRSALAVIARRYPEYDAEVQDFFRLDPPAGARNRVAIDALRSRRARVANGCIVLVTHHLGGGVDVHVRDLARRIEADGALAVTLTSHADGTVRVRREDIEAVYARSAEADVLEAIRSLAPRLVHFHAWLTLPAFCQAIGTTLGVPYDVTLHDFFVTCPRANFVRADGRYCGEPPVSSCELCIAIDGAHRAALAFEVAPPSVAEHRARERAFLNGARRVVAPSRDTAARAQAALGAIAIEPLPHPEALKLVRVCPPARERVRVAVIGGIGLHKGSRTLLEVARCAYATKRPIDIVVFGTTVNAGALRRLPNVTVTGPYAHDALPEMLARSGCTVAAFFSIWPETYSYTLSEALTLGLRPLAFDIGAPAERLRALGRGRLVPTGASAGEICEAIIELSCEPMPAELPSPFTDYPSILRDYYALDD